MLKIESETGDLKDLSDDAFLHLLKEASTFNKPNNQESSLLQQLRKEVADSDTCENASRSETGCVSKRLEHKCSTDVNSQVLPNTVTATSDLAPFPSTTFKIVSHKPGQSDDVSIGSGPMVVSVSEPTYSSRPQLSHHVLENEPGTDNWTVSIRHKKSFSSLPESSDHVSKTSTKDCEIGNKNERDIHALSSNYLCGLNSVVSDGVFSSSDARNTPKQEHHVKIESEFSNSLDKAVPTLVLNTSDYLSNDTQTSQNHLEQRMPSKGIQDIELTEFRRSPEVNNAQDKKMEPSSGAVSKDLGCNEVGSSKFYVNCSEVDSPVSYPLKFVSNLDERNGSKAAICDSLNDQSKQRQMNTFSTCYPWPGNSSTPQILFGPGSVDSDSLQNDSDCVARGNRGGNVPMMSATILDYPNSALPSENQTSKQELFHRKNKRTKNHSNNIILSENIAGHRGNDDVDALVEFIDAPKKDKTFSRNNPNRILPKNNIIPENFKKKTNGKESKSNQNKSLSLHKKKTQINDESSGGTTDDSKTDFNKNISSESEMSDDSCTNKNKVSSPDFTISPFSLDINSNVMESTLSDSSRNYIISKDLNQEVISNDSAVDFGSPGGTSSFANDFYNATDTVSQTVEEPGWTVLTKKQKKPKHQGKRSEQYRWRSAAARAGRNTSGSHSYYSKEQVDHGSGMMLLPGMALSQRGQCGNQDSRRKSTSSVPHSEQSSADNSDLDSVHSLPVRGSAPHPTKAHPHTTPSSSSSTPQASYADIARMPGSATSKLSPSVAANSGTPIVPPTKCCTASDKSQCNFDNWFNSSSENNPGITSFYESEVTEECAAEVKYEECEVKITDSNCKSTREINTQTEPLISSDNRQILDSNYSDIPVQDAEKDVCGHKATCTSPSCKDKPCVCAKAEKLAALPKQSERTQRPAVLMMGSIPTTEASDISFGIDLTEILQMSSDQHIPSDLADVVPNSTPAPSIASEEQQASSSKVSSVSDSVEDLCAKANFTQSSLNTDTDNKLCDGDDPRSTFHDNVSSPCNELLLLSGQKLQYKECNVVDTELFNYKQIVDLVAREWKNVNKEYRSELNKNGNKVKYYEHSC